MIRVFAILFLVALVSASASASEQWVNVSEGFGANFPTTPERTSVASSQSSNYAYQSVKNFSNGGALFVISISPIHFDQTKSDPMRFLEALNNEFIKLMGQNPNRAKTKWSSFGDGRKILNYEFEFTDSGAPFKGRGFWIFDNRRIIRVSVAYTESLTPKEIREVLQFLPSFVMVSDPKQ